MANFFHRWADLQKLERGEIVSPHFIDCHWSYICNQDCQGCAYAGKLNTEKKMWLPEDKAFDFTDQFMNAGVKAFDFAGGGEPTIPPYMPKLLEHIGKRGGTFGIITNGTLLRGPLLDAALKYGTYIRCSVEATNPEDYAAYKCVDDGHWTTVMANLKAAIEKRNEIKSPLEISVKFAVGKRLRGVQHYVDGIALGQKLGANRITFKSLRECPDELSPEEKAAEDRLLRVLLASVDAPNVHHWITPWKVEDIAQCWISGMHALSEWDANLYICCFHQWRKDKHRLGNMYEKKFAEIWYSDEHKAKQAGIDKHHCAKADCKFFQKHKEYADAKRGGTAGMLNFM